MIDIIYKNRDLITNNSDLELLYCIKDFPCFMGTTLESITLDLANDLNFFVSKSSGLVQIDPIFPPKIVYKHSHYSGEIGKAWHDHHVSFSDFIKKYNPKSVLELGSGHGLLKSFFNKEISWLMVDPNISSSEGISSFFNEEIDIESYSIDTVVHSHFLEHVLDINSFLSILNKKLAIGSRVIFSIPNLKSMIKKYYTNVLNFEHTFLITEEYIEYLFNRSNFKLIECVYYQECHSIFYAFKKQVCDHYLELDKGLYYKNKQLIEEYFQHLVDYIKVLNFKLQDEQDFYIFGAHVFSQFLIKLGLNTGNLLFVLDNNVKKQKQRLYGTSFYVESPEILRNKESPIVIINAGYFTNEIKEDIIKNINPSTRFI
jgi:SAM-dependent methyltransferase